MRAIQQQLPNARHIEQMRIFVQASPSESWKIARHFDLSSIHWIRFLFYLRTITEKLNRSKQDQIDNRLGVDQIVQNGQGFMLLQEEDGKEVVIGAIGKFWRLRIPFANISPSQFQKYHEPGWGKIAWSISVEPFLSGSTISIELRTDATDEESWIKFKRYYRLIGPFSRLIRKASLSTFSAQLHKLHRPSDEHRRIAGDEILSGATYVDTDHIDIEAPPSIVWQYLMQMGCDRGGWYSIDFLDNAGIPSTDHIVDEWTERKPGERIPANPKRTVFFDVLEVEHEKSFVLGAKMRTPRSMAKTSWAFMLEPIGSDATHLVVRAKMIMSQKIKEWLMGKIVYPPVHGLMESVQLANLKRFAERTARARMETSEV